MTNQEATKKRRIWTGVVVSDKMAKTLVVKVERVKVLPVYKKRFTVSKKYKVHVTDSKFKVGDTVSFVETKPVSKDKKWVLVN